MFYIALTVASVQADTSFLQPITRQGQCVDDPTAQCDGQSDVCNNKTFAQQTCPKYCGHCIDFTADCALPEHDACATLSGVCSDAQLAILMCPYTCGYCQGSTMPTVNDMTTTGSVPSTVMPAMSTTEALPQCPSCQDAIHTDDCRQTMETCPKNHVCQGTVKDWKVSMGCKSPLICQFAEYQGNRNCTSGHAFGPHEECSFCCQGDECDKDLDKVQEGLDTIPLVLHCPTCTNESDPNKCAQRIVPCDDYHTTCRVDNNHGYFTSRCDTRHPCRTVASGLRCRVEDRGHCIYCCHGSYCLDQAFGVTVGDTISTTTATGSCQDSDFYPCSFAKDVACNDPDMSLTVCPVTCKKCHLLTNT